MRHKFKLTVDQAVNRALIAIWLSGFMFGLAPGFFIGLLSP